MSTTLTISIDDAPRLTLGGVVSSERIKLLSRRSTLIIAALIAVMMIATASAMVLELDLDAAITAPQVAGVVVGGVVGAQFAGLALGAISVGSEYKTGRIRSVFAADPGRLRTLAAKSIVTAATTFAVTVAAAFIAYAVAHLVLVITGSDPQLIDLVVVRMLFGAGLHVAAVTVMGVGMAAALKKTAPAISLVLALIWTLPAAATMLPTGIAGTVVSYMPSTAGASLYAASSGESAAAFSAMSVSGAETLPFGLGLVVVLGWVALFLALGAWRTVRRDV